MQINKGSQIVAVKLEPQILATSRNKNFPRLKCCKRVYFKNSQGRVEIRSTVDNFVHKGDVYKIIHVTKQNKKIIIH